MLSHRGSASAIVENAFLRVHHLRAGHIALLVEEVQETGLLLHADLQNLFGLAALLAAAGHLRAGDVALLVDVVKETLNPLNADLLNLLSYFSDLRTDAGIDTPGSLGCDAENLA